MTHTEGGDIEYGKTTAVHPLTLIREVKKYEILYNKQLHEYTDNTKKEQIWENIHQVLFPHYEGLSETTKNVIKRTVRKRWKSLRDALVKDHRMRTDDVTYRLKKQNPMVKEMQFLVPFLKIPRHKNLQDLDGNDNYDDSIHSPDFCKLMEDTTIDLTFHEGPEEPHVQIDDDDMVSSEALYPSVRLTTSESESGEVEWRNGLCISAANEFKSTMNYTIREVEDPVVQQEPEFQQPPDNEAYVSRKRKRLDSSSDLQAKIVDLVERCNMESQDEDRMFLLSLLSDFKRVPVHKKLKVKSAFVKALSDALD